MRIALLIGLTLSFVSFGQETDAAGRRPYGGQLTIPLRHAGGIWSPHQKAVDVSGRMGAELAHCRLLRVGSRDQLVGELAESWTFKASKKSATLEVNLRRGGTFHNGEPILARHVENSFKRYKGLGGAEWLKELLREISVRKRDPRTLRFTAPTRRGGHQITEKRLTDLLARPELAILHINRNRVSGCGPYRPDGASLLLKAFDGHPLGRPWIDRVRVKRFSNPSEEETLFVYRTLDVSFIASHKYVDASSEAIKAYSTLFLLPAPYLRGNNQVELRRKIFHLMRRYPLAGRVKRHGNASTADGIWPRPLSTLGKPPKPRSGVLSGDLEIAYPKGDEELRKIAALVRDVMKTSFQVESVSSPPISGLSLEKAVQTDRPGWDFALVLLHWSAHTPEQAIFEAKVKLGLKESLSAKDFFEGARVQGRASVWNRRLPAIPLLHIERKIHHWGDVVFAPSVETPHVSDSWKRRK